MTTRAFYGTIIHTTDLYTLDYVENGLLIVTDGKISYLDKVPRGDVNKHLPAGTTLTELDESQFLIPGLIDTHTHAPQFPNVGVGHEYELLDWLNNVTFPMEARFKDPNWATHVYSDVVQRTLNAGTTTCSYYATLHETAAILAEICHDKGQRALVGNCNMNRHGAPYLQEASTEESLATTRTVIAKVRALQSSLVAPVVTPRFAICCTDDLLKGLGELLKEDPSLAIQTHLNESPGEILFTNELFPDAGTYTKVYDQFSLLRDNTILAHCIHMSDEDMDLVKSRECGISHCPTSNLNLRSGLADIQTMIDKGIKVSLGTDCSGGFGIGILHSIRHAFFVNKVRAQVERDNTGQPEAASPLSLSTMLYVATMGGAQVCGVADKVGNFALGKEFDALLIDMRTSPTVFSMSDDTVEKSLEKFLFTGDDRNIRKVFVQGRLVGGADV